MKKWIVRVLIVCMVGFGGYALYDYYRAGLHTRPDMPEGAFSISYKNGLRAILVDLPNERATRRYLGLPLEVPFYLKDAWSFCSAPSAEERVELLGQRKLGPGQRYEAICRIEIDEEVVVRGIISTVPKL